MQHFRFNASEMWIILLITAGQNRISAAALLPPLHFYTSPLLGTSQKGSWFSCGLSFVLAAGGAEPLENVTVALGLLGQEMGWFLFLALGPFARFCRVGWPQ